MPKRLTAPPLHRTLRFRVALATLLVVTGVFALVHYNTDRVLAASAVESSRATSRQVAETLNLALAQRTADADADLTPYLQELISPDSEGLLYLVLLDEQGHEITRTREAPAPLPPVDIDLASSWPRGVLHLQQPILIGTQQVGQLRYGLSTRLLRDTSSRLSDQNLALAIGVLVLLSMLLLWSLQRLGRRLAALNDAGRRLATGDYDIQAPTDGDDELTLIGHEFNLMADAVRARIQALEDSRAAVNALNAELEARVQRRTHELSEANQQLQHSLADLRRLQDGLVQSEKLASLGALVAAVAHELNTPIGNALTVATGLTHKSRQFERAARERLQRQTLEQFLADSDEACVLLQRNLRKASELITSFKHVAIDQTSSQCRRFDLARTVGDVLATLSPSIKHRPIEVLTELEPGISMLSYPGPLGQVLTNLHTNAALHAFAPEQPGVMRIRSKLDGPDQVRIEFSDDGMGMDAATLHRVFDPFFTTRLGQGGSGLGMHIAHNIVVGLLQGQIEVLSTPGAGTRVCLLLPRVVSQADAAPVGWLDAEVDSGVTPRTEVTTGAGSAVLRREAEQRNQASVSGAASRKLPSVSAPEEAAPGSSA